MRSTVKINDSVKFMRTLVKKAYSDEVFKKKLIENPKGTLENIVGANLGLPQKLIFM